MDTMLRRSGLPQQRKARGRKKKEINSLRFLGTSPVNRKEFPAFLIS